VSKAGLFSFLDFLNAKLISDILVNLPQSYF
jgi:hypothetical protein